MEESKIRVEREKALFNRARDFQLSINDVQKGSVSSGNKITMHVEPGTYMVKANMGRLGSEPVEVTVKSGEILNLHVSNTPAFVKADAIIALIFIVLLCVFLLSSLDKSYTYTVYALFGVYMTIKHYVFKNKYLTLKIKDRL